MMKIQTNIVSELDINIVRLFKYKLSASIEPSSRALWLHYAYGECATTDSCLHNFRNVECSARLLRFKEISFANLASKVVETKQEQNHP
jgi:hypothetical protein